MALVLVAVVAVAGLLITHPLKSTIATWDLHVEQSLARGRTNRVDDLARWGSQLASTIPVILSLVVIGATLRVLTGRWRASAFLAMAVIGEKGIYIVASWVVRRDRPPVPTVGSTVSQSSFPSGHVGAAVTLYGAVALLATMSGTRRSWRLPALALVAAIAAFVAYSRMYAGFHYPSDVLAGATLGIVWLGWSWAVVRPDVAHRP